MLRQPIRMPLGPDKRQIGANRSSVSVQTVTQLPLSIGMSVNPG